MDVGNFQPALLMILAPFFTELGVVVGEAENRAMIDGQLLILKKVDIVFIDPFMPNQDGIETIHHIGSAFTGKYIMISQIKTKKLIAEAYSLGDPAAEREMPAVEQRRDRGVHHGRGSLSHSQGAARRRTERRAGLAPPVLPPAPAAPRCSAAPAIAPRCPSRG